MSETGTAIPDRWDDLRERLEKAERELREMSEEGYIEDRVRLRSKASGVALALDYMRGYGSDSAGADQ